MKTCFNLCIGILLVLLVSACGQQATSFYTPIIGTPILPALPDCKQAELIKETIPAGSEFQAGVKFDKTWVIRNTSPCEWSSQYSLVYYDGIGMGAKAHRVFTENMPPDTVIHPGENATLTLNLRAPYAPGRQVGYWKLRDPSGMLFMPSNNNQESLSVDINVVGTVYSYADNLCQANWELDGKPLNCPVYDVNGTVRLFTDHFPHLEFGGMENEPAISFLLPEKEGSIITAIYPARRIVKDDHLHVITACANDTPQCGLSFVISYLSDADSGVLGEWYEVSDAKFQSIDLDLSDLAGKNIKLVFSVRSDASIKDNRGYWFFPVLLPY